MASSYLRPASGSTSALVLYKKQETVLRKGTDEGSFTPEPQAI